MKLKVVLELSEDGGFTALVPALPGCVSEGETREAALANIREAIELYLEAVEDDLPVVATAETVDITLSPRFRAWVTRELSRPFSVMDGWLSGRKGALFGSRNTFPARFEAGGAGASAHQTIDPVSYSQAGPPFS